MATANTLGFGSDSGLYASGTRVLNFGWLDRWDVVVHVDYLPADDEVRLLHSRFPGRQKDLLRSAWSNPPTICGGLTPTRS